jgi:putative transcriptional regulator
MTIRHHPSDELLLDYASGALGEGWSLAIATHLALCPACRRRVSRLESIGGSMIETISPEPVERSSLEAVLARLDERAREDKAAAAPVAANGRRPVLPQPLRGYLGSDVGGLSWRRLGLGAHQVVIPTREGTTKVRLLRIPAGRPVPDHSHRGLELTLVLAGAFTDCSGLYARGDLQEADDSLEHQPRAEPGEDCVCLTVTDAPLRFRNFAARLVQPLLRI